MPTILRTVIVTAAALIAAFGAADSWADDWPQKPVRLLLPLASRLATGLLRLLPFAREGKIKLLVLTNRERSPAAPELPTARAIRHPELAADGFQASSAAAACR